MPVLATVLRKSFIALDEGCECELVSSKNREQNQQKKTLDLLKAKGFNFTAEREGFEPPVRLRTTVFKTVAIDHSAISPNDLLPRMNWARPKKRVQN